MRNIFKIIIVFIFVTLFSLMVYGVAQQTLRMSMNMVPATLATDAIYKLENGIAPKSVTLPPAIELSKSISPFVMILDANGKVLVSSAILNGKVPTIPSGIFDFVNAKGEDRVTWQPEAGVREATVINRYTAGTVSGYVVAGTSLKESEATIDKIGRDIFIGWVIINVFSVISLAFLELIKKR
jgi:hypothetical protein